MMQISRLKIENFRGIKAAEIFLHKHSVLIGDNNTGKTTTFEAIDLVLGPDRLNRNPPIDEHDFFQGHYLDEQIEVENSEEKKAAEAEEQAEPEQQPDGPKIFIEVTITDLSDEQKAHFNDHIEFWDTQNKAIYQEPNPEGVDSENVVAALRVNFIGKYCAEEDDFEGNSYFSRAYEIGQDDFFRKKDKRLCGFLYLRSLRTASRAVSLERGSLLDIILRLKELRPQMWESTITKLQSFDVAGEPELGISGVLESINEALKKYVPKEWGVQPHLKVSNLTRENLRKVVTAFIATGNGPHAAPFYRQGTGTINMLVLAMLSIIAEEKQNVIFAMEEPETAIPPYAQKRIVHEVLKLASQSLFTSHSPYVLEEFSIGNTVVLSRGDDYILHQHEIQLPKSVKLKSFQQEFRTRFCEGLLSRRVLLAEGATEADSISAVFRRLEELNPERYSTLESLGICTIDAGSENKIKGLANLYSSLGKEVYAFCDKQSEESKAAIEAAVDMLFMHQEKGFEDLVIKNTSEDAIKRYIEEIEWPEKVLRRCPQPEKEPIKAFRLYLIDKKAEKAAAEFLVQCNEDEIPSWLREACIAIKDSFEKRSDDSAEVDVADTELK